MADTRESKRVRTMIMDWNHPKDDQPPDLPEFQQVQTRTHNYGGRSNSGISYQRCGGGRRRLSTVGKDN